MSTIGKGDGIAFDGNAAFPLNIHIVQNLILKISFVTDAGKLNQAVGKRGFAVVNMSNDAEVSNIFHSSQNNKDEKALMKIWGLLSNTSAYTSN
jgi:hypothetical protein